MKILKDMVRVSSEFVSCESQSLEIQQFLYEEVLDDGVEKIIVLGQGFLCLLSWLFASS